MARFFCAVAFRLLDEPACRKICDAMDGRTHGWIAPGPLDPEAVPELQAAFLRQRQKQEAGRMTPRVTEQTRLRFSEACLFMASALATHPGGMV